MAITLARMSFGGIAFPFVEYSLNGAHRNHVHEYPHAQGGDPEKLGRKLYVVRVTAWFHELTGPAAQAYPDLWPSGLKRLREMFESGETKDLVIPTIGTIRAFATQWTQKYVVSNAPDGEKVDIEFCEDEAGDLLAGNEAKFAAESMVEALALLNEQMALLEARGLARKPNIFEQLNDLVGGFVALKDQAQAQATLLSDKVESIKALCQEVESVADFVNESSGVGVGAAVRSLWTAANAVGDALVVPASQVLTHIVPSRTTVVDLSALLYGRTDKVSDLLKLNAFIDPFGIPAGTVVRYAVAG